MTSKTNQFEIKFMNEATNLFSKEVGAREDNFEIITKYLHYRQEVLA